MKRKNAAGPGSNANARPIPRKQSGAQGRKRAKERLEAERRADAARQAGRPADEGAEAMIAPYVALGKPVLGDPTAALVRTTDTMLLALHEAATDPHTDAGTRRRMIAELGRAIGSTHSKSLIQGQLQALRRYDQEEQDRDDGLVPNPLYRPRSPEHDEDE